MKKNWFTTGLTAILIAAMLATGVGAVSMGGGTTTTAVNFRTGAGTGNSIIATLPAGTAVIVQESAGNGWYKVIYNGTTGYISGDYLKISTTASGSFGTGTVTASSVNFRSGASLNAGIIGSLSNGAAVTIIGVNGNWYQVQANGQTGYVSSDYIKVGGSAAPAPGGNGGQSTGGTAGTVKGDYVRMRSGPGTGYAILGTYNNGTALTINGTESGWTKVTIGGVNGYIRSDYVAASGGSSGGQSTSQTGYINGTSVRMRSGPNTSSTILGVYNTGTAMTITGSSGNWYAVTYNGQNGYVCKDYMTTSNPGGGSSAPSQSQEGYVKGNGVRLRSGPGTGYSILGNYNNGTPLTITGTSGDWTAVTINGLKGYMSSAYVTTTKPSVTSANPNSTSTTPSTSTGGQQIVDTAKQYLGYPYVYGGMSPAGFDCSGFVGYVYKLCGYSLKRVASDIYYNNGTSVSKDNLQPGDLVFFSNSSESIGHVGIYIGSGQFIHASSSTVGVIISDLNSSYYVQHYQGAKRIIQ